jgi:hypothetical protein
VRLRPGEAAWVKESFLQASDEELKRKTRFVFDWRIPVTSVACGLTELIELRNGTADRELSVTFSTQEEATTELALVDVPAGSGLVLRPRFLVGVIKEAEQRLVVRRVWKLLWLQSWITLQFRYFIFEGPCRLVVAGKRGVRLERVQSKQGQGRRTNQDSTIGFGVGLDYRSTRAETFWAYYRGANPLFDDLFSGQGSFLCQEITTPGGAARARRFWSQLWNGVTKIFGL